MANTTTTHGPLTIHQTRRRTGKFQVRCAGCGDTFRSFDEYLAACRFVGVGAMVAYAFCFTC